jgi:hypothetical protein
VKGNHKATKGLKALAHKVLAGNQPGNCKATTLEKKVTFEATSSQKLPKKCAYSGTRFYLNEHCQGCPYHDTGPLPDGKGIIHWCGPWEEANGNTRYWNIAELTACPKRKWGNVSETVH